MELKSVEAANLQALSSFSLPKLGRIRIAQPCKQFRRSLEMPCFVVRSVKRNAAESPKVIRKESKGTLSRILRTEAAVKSIERKANCTKYTTLWPKSVLEALDDAISSNQWESALKIFELLCKQRWYKPRCQTYTKLLTMLGKCKQPGQASLLFKKMLSEGLNPTIDVYTSLVGAYGFSGYFNEAFNTVDDMKSIPNCKPDVYTYTVLINCCTKLKRFDMIDRILTEMSYLGIECSIVTYNTIIDGYGKAGMFDLMESFLTDMVEASCLPDVFTLNSFIGSYGNVGKIEDVERWYDEFQHMGVKPDAKTFNILIRSYGKAGMYEKMVSVMEFMDKRFFSPTTVTFNTVIETFGKAGNIEKMEYFFRTMKYKGIKPNCVTYCSLVNGYSKVGLQKKLNTILQQIVNSDVVLDTAFFNCIISAYGQAGELREMEEMFWQMKDRKCKPDLITFATMIQSYNAHGMGDAARECEKIMLDMQQNSGTL